MRHIWQLLCFMLITAFSFSAFADTPTTIALLAAYHGPPVSNATGDSVAPNKADHVMNYSLYPHQVLYAAISDPPAMSASAPRSGLYASKSPQVPEVPATRMVTPRNRGLPDYC